MPKVKQKGNGTMSRHKVIISSVVYDDLNTHLYFLAKTSPQAARKLKSTIVKDIRSLADFPDRNPIYDRPYSPSGRYRYMLSFGRYRIVYQVDKDTVYVDGIEDCRQEKR